MGKHRKYFKNYLDDQISRVTRDTISDHKGTLDWVMDWVQIYPWENYQNSANIGDRPKKIIRCKGKYFIDIDTYNKNKVVNIDVGSLAGYVEKKVEPLSVKIKKFFKVYKKRSWLQDCYAKVK